MPDNQYSIESLPFVVTAEHECGYLPDQQATTLFVAPEYPLHMAHYTQLARLGFRRSGNHVYRPHCKHCGLCIPVRIPVNAFKPDRSQRRNLKRNNDISVSEISAIDSNEHFQLYRKYMRHRHPGGGMDNDSREAYHELLKAAWSNSSLLEFRLDKQLVMVAVIDVFDDGLSAVYTFFDPDYPKRGLGVYAILSQIRHARSCGLEWLYLGYWNPQTRKMAYKSRYQPLEFFDGQTWHALQPPEAN